MMISSRVVVVLAAIAVMMVLGGCAGGDGISNPDKKPGDDLDVEYQASRLVISGLEDRYVDRIQDLLDLYRSVVATELVNFTGVVMQAPEYHVGSEYWYVEHIDTTLYGVEIGQDSVQFLHSGMVVEVPDSVLLAEVKGGSHWVVIDTATVNSSCAMKSDHSLIEVHLLFGMTGGPGEIAAGDVTISMTAASYGFPLSPTIICEWAVDFTATGDNLAINLMTDDCPKSGELEYHGLAALDCPPPLQSFGHIWDAKETFDNGSVIWHYENETHYWDADCCCGWYLSYR